MRGWPLQLGGRCTGARDREGGMSNPCDVEPAAGIPQPREPGRASTVPKLSDTSVNLPPHMQEMLPYTPRARASGRS